MCVNVGWERQCTFMHTALIYTINEIIDKSVKFALVVVRERN